MSLEVAMDLKQLKYFVTVVEEGNITQAAKRLHLSQPPLSYQMKLLEEELGIQLMERGSRNISLTEAGTILYERADMILKLADTTRQELFDLKDVSKSTLRLGTISSSGSVLLNERMRTFHLTNPNVCFEIHEGNTFQMIEMLKSGVIEVAIVRTPFKSEGFECIYLEKEPMIAVAKAEYFQDIMNEKIEVHDLLDKPLIYYRRFDGLIKQSFHNVNITPNIFCINDDARTTLMWANAGLGVAIVPRSIFDSIYNSQLIYKEITQADLNTQIAVIHKKDSYVSNACKCFLQAFTIIKA